MNWSDPSTRGIEYQMVSPDKQKVLRETAHCDQSHSPWIAGFAPLCVFFAQLISAQSHARNLVVAAENNGGKRMPQR